MLGFSIAVLAGSFINGMTALGGGILLLAVMTPLFPPAVLIPLHGIIQLISNSSRIVFSLKQINYKIFISFTLGAAIGSAAGIPFTVKLDQFFFTIILSAAILFFTWFPGIKKITEFRGKFFSVGAVCSFLSLFIGATGPLSTPFFVNSELNKETYVPTKSACQIPIHIFKLIVYLISGFVVSDWIFEILVAVPFVFAGTFLGRKAALYFDESRYRLLLKCVITFFALRMLYKVFF